MPLETGLIGTLEIIVQEKDTAAAIGEKIDLPAVLSTPQVVSFMETTAANAMAPFLELGQSSVGTGICIKHLAATPVGMTVHFKAELIAIDGRRLTYKVEAWDEIEKIAEGEHGRYIIKVQKFNENFKKKIESS